jgi:hypothetical protein
MKQKNVFNKIYLLIIVIILYVIIPFKSHYKNKVIKNNEILYPVTINLMSSFCSGEINEEQVIKAIKTILIMSRENKESIVKFINEYVKHLNNKSGKIKLIITRKNKGLYTVAIKKHGKYKHIRTIDCSGKKSFLRFTGDNLIFLNQKTSLAQLHKNIKDLDVFLLTQESYKQIKGYLVFQEIRIGSPEKWTLNILRVSNAFNNNQSESSYAYTVVEDKIRLYDNEKDKKENKNFKDIYLVIFNAPLFNNRDSVKRAQVLYECLEWINDIYNKQTKKIGLYFNAELNKLIQRGYEYRNKIEQNPDQTIDISSIQDPALRYYVLQYLEIKSTRYKIKGFNNQNFGVTWKWSNEKQRPETLAEPKYGGINKIMALDFLHQPGTKYMIASNLHNNNAKNNFDKVAEDFINSKTNRENVKLILLGNYEGEKDGVIWGKIIDLYNKYPDDVIILRGENEIENSLFGRCNFGITNDIGLDIKELCASLADICIIRNTGNNNTIVCMHDVSVLTTNQRHYYTGVKSIEDLRSFFSGNVQIVIGSMDINNINNHIISVFPSGVSADISGDYFLYVDCDEKGDFIFQYRKIGQKYGKSGERILSIREGLTLLQKSNNSEPSSVKYLNELTEISDKEALNKFNENVESIVNELDNIQQDNEGSPCIVSQDKVNFIEVLKEFPRAYWLYLKIIVKSYINKDKDISITLSESPRKRNVRIKIGFNGSEANIRDNVNYDIRTISKIDLFKVKIAIVIEDILKEEFKINLESKVFNIAEMFINVFKFENRLKKMLKRLDTLNLRQELEIYEYKKLLQAI